MTLEQTRQLGIEFERRVQTMIPETEFAAKLDTETIYSYLNQYQDKLIHDLYRTVDQIPVSNSETYLETLLNSMMTGFDNSYEDDIYNPDYASMVMTELPQNFGLYIDSYSIVESSYRPDRQDGSGRLHNQLVATKDVAKAMPKPHDSMKIIREPIPSITKDKHISVIYDRYTNPKGIHVDYYKVPQYMDLMTSTPCELPMEMFEQMVSGAVDLYVQYVAGAEARRRQMAEQQRQQNKKEDEQ